MGKVTVAQVAGVVLPTVEVEVPEWEGAITLRALTRGQIRDCRGRAAQEDGKLDLDTYDLAVLAWSIADPDLCAEVGIDEALRLLRAQPVQLVYRLIRECVRVSQLAGDAPFRGRAGDDDRR